MNDWCRPLIVTVMWWLAGSPPLLGGDASPGKVGPADGVGEVESKQPADAPAARAPAAGNSTDSERRKPVPAAAEDADKIKDITFDNLKFEIEKGAPFLREMLTEEIEALQGKRVRLRGYMLPSFQQRGIRQFVLVRDNMECCFGPGAALYDCVIVEMAAGKSTQFTVRPITVEGVFKVKELKGPDDKHLAVFEMMGHDVK